MTARIAAAALVTLLVGASAAVSLAVGAGSGAATARTWYVSRNGDDSTGRSWATAWNELDRIAWSEVRPGDTIVLDGGRTRCPSNYLPGATSPARPGLHCGMLYRRPLTVGRSGRPGARITIRLSRAAAHSGTAVLFGGRATALPYCDQQTYRAVGHGRAAGVLVPGRTHITLDGTHRSGVLIYGAQAGVDLASDRTAWVTLRNLEIADNGTYGRWAHGYETDSEGISLAGQHITIDRDLIHDNGQDAVQDRDTGVRGAGHAPLRDITVTNSWLYEHRGSPLFAGFGFNSGAQEIAAQDCTHVDGLQVWGGGLRQGGMTFTHDVFGPYLAQGIYPGDVDTASVDGVVISDALFLNALDHSIIGDPIAADPGTPANWHISGVTSYLTPRPDTGIGTHGSIDLAGTGHTLTNSIFVNGYFASGFAFARASGNIWSGGDPVAGGRRLGPRFVGPLPTTRAPSYATLTRMNLTPRCSGCAGVGARLHDVHDLLARIDALDRAA